MPPRARSSLSDCDYFKVNEITVEKTNKTSPTLCLSGPSQKLLLPKAVSWGASGPAGRCHGLLLPGIRTGAFVESILTAVRDLLENSLW